MKKLIIFFIIISTISCGNNIPKTNIEFIKIEKDTIVNGYFDLYFSSDTELINQFEEEGLSLKLDCFFKSTKITEKVYETYKDYVLTSIGDIKLISKKNMYNYVINTSFDLHNNKNNNEIMYNEIFKLINNNDKCLSCIINGLGYFNFKNMYISETMCLPKTEIKKVTKRKRR